MSAFPKDLFAVEFRNLPGKGVQASGGLQFQSDESTLRRRYAKVLEAVPLNTLVGEATLWVLAPSTVSIWAFPLLLWRLSIDLAVLGAMGLFLAAQVAQMLVYARWLNYIVLVCGNRAVQILVYTGCVAAFWIHRDARKALALAVWLILMATGVVQVVMVVPFMPVLKRLFALRPADQALRNVARFHARRMGLETPH